MYGIFTYIYDKNQPNVGIYAIHGSYGYIYIFAFRTVEPAWQKNGCKINPGCHRKRRNNFLTGAGCTMNYWTAGDGKRLGLNSRAKATASATSQKMLENAEVFDFLSIYHNSAFGGPAWGMKDARKLTHVLFWLIASNLLQGEFVVSDPCLPPVTTTSSWNMPVFLAFFGIWVHQLTWKMTAFLELDLNLGLLSRSSKKHSTTKIDLQRPRQKLILVRKHKVYTCFKSSSDGFSACRPCDWLFEMNGEQWSKPGVLSWREWLPFPFLSRRRDCGLVESCYY